MKVHESVEVKVTLEMNGAEAEWLKAYIQNPPMCPNCQSVTPGSVVDQEMRERLFDALPAIRL